jgi:para-nitrobenzyl esterase
MKLLLSLPTLLFSFAAVAQQGSDLQANKVQVASGRLAGATAASGIHEFKGIPYAAPPVGPRRGCP